MAEIEYLDVDQLIEINKRVLKEIKVKKADAHRVANRTKLESILGNARELQGDAFDKAALLLVELTRQHAFDSGNRRTAYAATRLFLEANGAAIEASTDPKVLTGIREGFYRSDEVVEWLKGNGIREFRRHHS